MRPDALVIRHRENGAPAAVALIMDCPVINAGDGTNEHPTQALLDAATIRHRFGKIDGLKVAICGDIRHSRVARSNAKLLPRLGAEVRLAGPPELMPDGVPPLSIDEAIAGADVVMMLRVQRERLDEDLGDRAGRISCRATASRAERLARAAPDAVVMHPGPMNRGVEIDGALADDRRAVADHASGRNGRGRSDGLPGDAARRSTLARGVLDRRVAGEPADEAFAAPVFSTWQRCLRVALGGEAGDRQAPEGALGRIEPGAHRQISPQAPGAAGSAGSTPR